MRVALGDDLADLYVDGDRAAAFVDHQVVVLSEVATAAVLHVRARGSVEVRDLSAFLHQLFGPPEGTSVRDATVAQVRQLEAHGLLSVVDEGSSSTPPLTSEAVEAVRSALAHVLGDGSSQSRWSLPPDVDGSAFLVAAQRHRVLPFLNRGLDLLDLPPDAQGRLIAMAAPEQAACDRLVSQVRHALRALDGAGVRALVMKGLPLAHQAYGDHTARGFGDLDLLVPPEDLATAHQALCEAGWRPSGVAPVPGATWGWRRCASQGHELSLSGVTKVDLHWHLTVTRGGMPTYDQLWGRRVRVSIDGEQVPTLHPYDALQHSATHAALDGWRWLRSLVDVFLLASDPDTWDDPGLPLRPDQALTLELTRDLFERPEPWPGRPDVSARQLRRARRQADRAHGASADPSAERRIPGRDGVRLVRHTLHARAGVRDLARVVAMLALPTHLLAQEPATSGRVAAPRILRRRSLQVLGAVRRHRWLSKRTAITPALVPSGG